MQRAAIISVDGHVKAPRAEYRDYVESRFHEQFDAWLNSFDSGGDGFVRPDIGESAQWTAQRRISDLESQGVVAEMLFPNGLPFAMPGSDLVRDPELARQADLAYNRWLRDFCSQAPGRLLGNALVSFDDTDQAVRDVHQAKEQGFGGIAMPALVEGSRFFFDPALDPIWAACQEVGLPLSQHGGVGAPVYEPAGFASIMVLATEHSFFSGRSLWQMILGGVFDRFPDLKLVLVETEAWWIVPVMELLDQRAQRTDDWTDFADFMGFAGGFTRLPTEYWNTNCYAGVSPFGSGQISLDVLGTDWDNQPSGFGIHSDNAMFGVDYPHPESIFPSTMDHVAELVANPHVCEDDARKILYGNASSVYPFDLDLLQPHMDRVGFALDEITVSS
jgi:predicted TIM-barrel fold metal-dependent hydrolase